MEEALAILQKCRTFLNECQIETQKILNDQVVREWKKIDINDYASTLELLGLPQNIIQAHAQYNYISKEIFQIKEVVENEVGSLEADIRLKLSAPKNILLAAKEAEKKCARLEGPKATLASYWQLLNDSYKKLQDNLTLPQLIPLARKYAKSKGSFDLGLRVIKAIADEEDLKGTSTNMYEYFIEATKLETRLGKIDTSELPALAATITKNYIGNIISAAGQIKNFIDSYANDPTINLADLKKIKSHLSELHPQPVPLLLASLVKTAENISEKISDFSRQDHVLEDLNYLAMILHDITTFSLVVPNDLMQKLQQNILAAESALNPAVYATQKAKVFFNGARGLLRIIRLIFMSFLGHKVITTPELERTITAVITTCFVSLSDIYTESSRLTECIDNHLSQYKKPFPGDELSALLLETLKEYGDRLEKFINNFDVAPQYLSDDENIDEPESSSSKSIKLGRLVNKITSRIDYMQKNLDED